VYLVQAIMPLVRARLRDARVRIVGADPPPSVRRLASSPWVTVTGFVDDMRPHLESAAVFACPLRFGAGIQNKVLEAMAMEVPVVTTSIAADGLRVDGSSSPPLMVADDPEAFAGHLVRALERASSGGPPDGAARTFVARNFDWATNASRLEAILAAALR
jgi:glycosyltransferase involved in cell wall biosynthesis